MFHFQFITVWLVMLFRSWCFPGIVGRLHVWLPSPIRLDSSTIRPTTSLTCSWSPKGLSWKEKINKLVYGDLWNKLSIQYYENRCTLKIFSEIFNLRQMKAISGGSFYVRQTSDVFVQIRPLVPSIFRISSLVVESPLERSMRMAFPTEIQTYMK